MIAGLVGVLAAFTVAAGEGQEEKKPKPEPPAFDIKCVIATDREILSLASLDKYARWTGRSVSLLDGTRQDRPASSRTSTGFDATRPGPGAPQAKSSEEGCPDKPADKAQANAAEKVAKVPDNAADAASGNPAVKAATEAADDKAQDKAADSVANTPKSSTTLTSGKLVGAGDIEVYVKADSYKKAANWVRDNPGAEILLYVNGVPLPADADLIAVEPRTSDVRMRYSISPGKESQVLWAMLYRNGGLTDLQDLRVALGWKGTGPATTPQPTDGVARLAISNPTAKWLALVIIAVLLAITIWIGRTTDALRDSPSGDLWKQVRTLRNAIRATWLRKLTKNAPDQNAVIKARFPNYDPLKIAEYKAAAYKALQGEDVSADQEGAAVVGLALLPEKDLRAAYSLSRIQLAMWFAFAVAAGVFLWVVYGELPAIDGSLLALLGLSVGTAGVSLAVHADEPSKFSPSRNIVFDLVTGSDDKHQVHRYQAVIVNILLLFVGITHVMHQLTYPIFDATWLALLGVSGAALGLGKQLLEKPKAADTVGAPPGGGAGGGGGGGGAEAVG